MSNPESSENEPPSERGASGRMGSVHDVGVLFVRGIGRQRRREMLIDFGEPLVPWIRRWIDGLRWRLNSADFFAWLADVEHKGANEPEDAESSVRRLDTRLDDPELEALTCEAHPFRPRFP
jgi:hypothetical protein